MKLPIFLLAFVTALSSCSPKSENYESQNSFSKNPRFELKFSQSTPRRDFEIYLDTKTGQQYLVVMNGAHVSVALMPKESPLTNSHP